ncbi:MAG: hypothetical protein M1822_009776 [Bathelium mastoideum]|nr:MAG: hypothetical protein M1822_009776 [Bathelium mastoideum]
MAKSHANHQLVDMIDAAAFLICLDDAAPSDATERSNHFLLADPSYRWSDKVLQFVVCSNGTSAYVCEHSSVDGTTFQQLNEALKVAIINYEPRRTDLQNANGDHAKPKLDKHIFEIDKDIESHIERVQQGYGVAIPKAEHAQYTYKKFGSNLLRTHYCSPKIGFQLVIQLASLLYFGHQPPSWETVCMRSFHKGRVDIFQTVLPSVARFCAAMQNPRPLESQSNLRQLFSEAAKSLTATLMRVSRGRGFAAHLYALQEVVGPDEEVPLLFRDPTYSRTRPAKIMTDCVPWQDVIQDGGFVMPDPDFVWVHYEVREDSCWYAIKGPLGKTRLFLDALEVAGEKVRILLEN